MGHDIKKLREADVNTVAKKLVKAEPPCTSELGALLDCMKRAGVDNDSVCAKERAALSTCAGRHARMPQNVSAEKRQVVRQLQHVIAQWKRFGY